MAERAAPGWVYVLTHPAWDKLGMVKIGKTGRDPGTRAAEITAVSGLLAPCTVAWCAPVADIATAEMAVHRMLARQRVRKRRELFRVDVVTARRVVEAVASAPGSSLARPVRRTGSFSRRRPARTWRQRRGVPPLVRLVAGLVATGALLMLLRRLPLLP